MQKNNIYECSHETSIHLPKIIEKFDIDYALANHDGLKMGELAEKIYNESSADMAVLPFGHTIEAQAFGAKVEFDYIYGDKIVDYPQKINTPNPKGKHVQIVFEAMEYLKNRNIPVSVTVTGPVSIATSLLPAEEVFRKIAKDTEDIKKLFLIIEDFLRVYIRKLVNLGVGIIYYADPTGTLDIIGNRLYKRFVGTSFLSVLKDVDFNNKTLIHMCPKSSSSLLVADMIEEDEEGIISGGSCIFNKLNVNGSRRYRIK